MVGKQGSYLYKLKEDSQISAVTFIQTGEKPACSGMNENQFNGLTPQDAHSHISEIKGLCELVRTIPKLVIVAINGHCIGVALELVYE